MAIALPNYLSDHPNLVGIVRFPNCTTQEHDIPIPLVIKGDDGKYKSVRQGVKMAHTITGSKQTSGSYPVPKNNVTDFYPYTYYVLTDGETEPLIMYPQYMKNSISIIGDYALSNQPVERYYPNNYKGSTDGVLFNITNANQMMLPTATNEGLAYMNANGNIMAQTRKSQITGNVLNAIGSGVSAIANPMTIGYGASSVISGLNSIKETDARNKDIMLTPSTISSFGSPSTRNSFNTDNVKLIRFTIEDKVKTKILNFINRYGSKFNNYDVINLKTYKGYLKVNSPDIDGAIDNIYINKIIDVLERGVYIE